ncbi:MAG TPA: cysteine-rich CWC family protein [Burkholderiaceae bacterium]|nr:cysteine-rich CWC family protein [Burkholderiaceae bacterium]
MAAILTEPLRPESCARCGASFGCGARSDACWCAGLPALQPLPAGFDGCLCPDCLRSLLDMQRSGRTAPTRRSD